MTTNAVTVGELAPDFTLPSTAGGDVTLSRYRNESNVLLAFFPLAFTSTCTAELCDFTTEWTLFDGVATKVFGVSVDSVPSLQEFRRKHDIKVDLLSDFKRDVCRLYGTLIEELFFSERAYFIVDRRGILRWMHVESDLGDKRDNSELLVELRKLQV